MSEALDVLKPRSQALRIAAFGFRSVPSTDGCAGADKFAAELFSRLAERGHQVTLYNRLYPGMSPGASTHKGMTLVHIPTVAASGFDTLLHSLRATWHIIRNDTSDVVHMQNGGNSIFAVFLRLAGKRVYLSQDGVDWRRDKWTWYAKLFLFVSSYLTAFAPNRVIFDNVFVKAQFEKRFKRPFDFIPFGSEVAAPQPGAEVLERLGLKPGEYFLFVGRFIPDKGLQYLIPAFERVQTDKKLVLVGGAPNPGTFEQRLRSTEDSRILFPGYVYGADAHALMKHAYAYVQPSDVEGLSPVILENMGLGTPVICSDIEENRYVVEDTALLFRRGDVDHLAAVLEEALDRPEALEVRGERGRKRAHAHFSWEAVTQQHEELFVLDSMALESAGGI